MADNELEAIFELGEEQEFDCEFRIDATTFDYTTLDNKPQINGEVLEGDKSSSDLHLASEQGLLDEIINRQEADNVLDNKIDDINANLTQQIEETQQDVNNKYNELVNDIDEEIQARETADTTINQRITDVADELQQSIEDNVVALQQEDTALQNQINAHSTTLTAYDTRITNNANAISQEVINRQNADDTLQEQIDNLKARGRFLSLWNATTGLAETNPEIDPYPYNTGDYFIVGTVGEVNYKPTGTQYVIGQASTVVETEELASEDVYYFDGQVWHLQVNHGKTVSFANLAGQPSDNIALKQALDGKQAIGDYATNTDLTQGLATKQNILISGTNIKTLNYESLLGEGNIDITSAQWGNITGILANQTDLQTVLDSKQPTGDYALKSEIPTKTSELINDSDFITTTYHDDTKQDVITDLNDIRNNIATNTSNISYLDEKVRDIELFKFPNAVIIGEPTIQNGQVSGFSTVSYLQFPFILDLHEKAFQIDFSFTTATNVQTQQNILDSNFGLALAIQNGKGVMAISSNGTTWDIGSATGSINIQSNTTYYARLIWNRLQYKTQLSTDGVNYVDDMVIVDTRSPYPRTMFIGGCDILETGHTGHPFLGTINMNKASLSVMGNVIWQGMDDAGLATRADLSLSNLDELGNKRFTDLQTAIDTKASNSDLTAHTSNGTIHVTASDKIAWSNKQNAISDLDTIRTGASKGATALQSVPSEYITETELSNYHDSSKQDKMLIVEYGEAEPNYATMKQAIDDGKEVVCNYTFGDNLGSTRLRLYNITDTKISFIGTLDDSTTLIAEKKHDKATWYSNFVYMADTTFVENRLSTKADTSYVNNGLATKVDTSTLTRAYPVVEVSDRSILPSWYRVYADGFCVQGRTWGNIPNGSTYTFLKPLSHQPTVLIQNIGGTANNMSAVIAELSGSHLTIADVCYGSGTKVASWQVSGFLA